MAVDLHLHTIHSDGTWSPTQLVEKAISLRLKHIAITDHDTVDGLAEAEKVAGIKIEIIPGIEINTVWTNADGKQQDVHILGYFIDRTNAKLKAVMEKQQWARNQLVAETLEMVKSAGITLTMEDVQASAGIGSIGRPHLTKAIVKAGGARDVNEAYEKFMRRTSPYYVARKSVGPQEAIAAIKDAGGISSLAHPSKDDNSEDLIARLKTYGLDAVEAFHRSHTLPHIRRLMRCARLNKMLITGGSDCHGPYEQYPESIGSIRVPLHVVQDLKSAREVRV
jgi:3',5'-nucleoside bisphosphate phosphatase